MTIDELRKQYQERIDALESQLKNIEAQGNACAGALQERRQALADLDAPSPKEG